MKYTRLFIKGCIYITLFGSCKSMNSIIGNDQKIISLEQYSTLSSEKTASIDSFIRLLPQGSEVGISIYNLTRNKPIYTYRDKKLSRPASTMKLLTTITTLSYPQGKLPFTTEVWYTGNITCDTLKGNIYIKGCMDPEFDDEAMDSLINQIKKVPFKVLKGKIIGDLSMKDSLYWGSGWMWDDAPYDYQPNLSPLMLHKGTVTITATPDSIGKKAIITTTPQSNYYSIQNRTESNSPESGTFDVTRDYINQSNKIIVKGNVNKKLTASITVSFSQNYFLQTFVQRLKEKGNKEIIGSYTCTYLPNIDYSKAHKIGEWSTDCQSIIKQMLKESDNLNAEAMFYRLGNIYGSHPSTAEAGTNAINKLITRLGLDPNNYNIADGCGLSNYDNISPQLEVSFLKYAYQHPDIYHSIYPALPIAGIDGTLKYRMKENATIGNVHAKTGSYTAINTLAGYLTSKKGEKIAFSIMNQSIFSAKKARDFQDAICKLLCN